MRAILAFTSFVFLLTSAGAFARGDAAISGSDWRSIVSGKTLHFERRGKPAGKMFFLPRSTNFVFIDADGKCLKGWFNGRYDEVKYHFIGRRKPGSYTHVRAGSLYMLKDLDGDEDLRVARMTEERLRCTATAKDRKKQREVLERLIAPKKKIPGNPVGEVIEAMSGKVGPVFYDAPSAPRGGLRITLRVRQVEKAQAVDVMRRLCQSLDRGRRLGDASTIEIVNSSGKQGFRSYSGVKACNPGRGVSRAASISALSRF